MGNELSYVLGFWDSVIKYTDTVFYYVYEKRENSYVYPPTEFYSTDKNKGFKISFDAKRDFLVYAIMKYQGKKY